MELIYALVSAIFTDNTFLPRNFKPLIIICSPAYVGSGGQAAVFFFFLLLFFCGAALDI